MRKTILLFILTLSLSGGVAAQQELGTHLMRGTWQAAKTNPAMFPQRHFVVGLPGVYNNLNISNITYNDLVSLDETGQPFLDINRAISKLESKNQIRENLEVESLSLGLQAGKFFLSAGHSVRFNAFINYPKTLPQLIWQGNAQFIGQQVNFSSDLQLFGYNEFFVGSAFKLNQRLAIGARAKWLNGFGDISTDRTRLSLFTDEEAYQLSLDADFRINSTGLIRYNGLRNIAVDYDFANFKAEQIFTRNTGVAFDLGAYWSNQKFDLAVSVLDLGGRIQWREQVQNYSLNGLYEYRGLDIAPDLLADSARLGNALDTLLAIYNFTESYNGYATRLPVRFYLSAAWQLNETWRLSGLFYNETYRGETFPAVAAGVNAQLFSWLNVGATYAFRNGRFDNLGVNTNLQFGPLQLITMTDNLLSALRPKDSNSANVRVGLNLFF